ncbi:MAG: SAM-dependent methyltransferase [Verrucomicrobia bacterium]|nr:SAM-dependent methyltransferase [Verrucomicrobiota bacterium]
MNSLNETIRQAIVSEGAISFARFMELALYCPVYGYYEREEDTIGRAGDFYTNVSVGSLYGELLAFQFARWLSETAHENRQSAKSRPVQLVEAGAHDGQLAADILTWLQKHQPEGFGNVEYWIIEPSPRRRNWQMGNLRAFAEKVVWFDSLEALPQSGVCGIIFSNEFLDALPTHRFAWEANSRSWMEWGVTLKDDAFVWTSMPGKAFQPGNGKLPTAWPDLSAELLAVLPDGFMTEVCVLAENWWRQASNLLRSGKLLTIDYGLTTEQFFQPARMQGTLRAYHRHRVSGDVLAKVGEQDLTAHVNFTPLQCAGEAAGLMTDSFCSQAQFLTRIAEQIWRANGARNSWTPAQLRQFRTLTHPEHLGRPFRVLIQSR